MVLIKKEIEFWKKKTKEENPGSVAEHGACVEAPLAPEGGLASHL